MKKSSLKKWDIVLAHVEFEEIPQSKIRPVLVIDDDTSAGVLVDCLKITGQPPRAGEYVLRRWKEVGLDKPTTVRVSKFLQLSENKLIKKIGNLQIEDIIEIEKLI